MDVIWEGLMQSLRLIVSGDDGMLRVLSLSSQISGAATLLSLIIGMPLGAALALARFPGRSIVVGLINTGMGLPPTAAGLFVTILLWRNGFLGVLHVLYTPPAMIIDPA